MRWQQDDFFALTCCLLLRSDSCWKIVTSFLLLQTAQTASIAPTNRPAWLATWMKLPAGSRSRAWAGGSNTLAPDRLQNYPTKTRVLPPHQRNDILLTANFNKIFELNFDGFFFLIEALWKRARVIRGSTKGHSSPLHANTLNSRRLTSGSNGVYYRARAALYGHEGDCRRDASASWRTQAVRVDAEKWCCRDASSYLNEKLKTTTTFRESLIFKAFISYLHYLQPSTID